MIQNHTLCPHHQQDLGFHSLYVGTLKAPTRHRTKVFTKLWSPHAEVADFMETLYLGSFDIIMISLDLNLSLTFPGRSPTSHAFVFILSRTSTLGGWLEASTNLVMELIWVDVSDATGVIRFLNPFFNATIAIPSTFSPIFAYNE